MLQSSDVSAFGRLKEKRRKREKKNKERPQSGSGDV